MPFLPVDILSKIVNIIAVFDNPVEGAPGVEQPHKILRTMASFFTAPVERYDEERARLVRILFYTSLVTLLVSVILHVLIFNAPSNPIATIIGSFIRIASGMAIIVMLRRGAYDASVTLFLAALWLSFAISMTVNGGVYSFGYRTGFLILIVIASLLTTIRTAYIVTALSVLYGLYLAEYFPSTEFLSLEYYRNPYRVWLISACLFVITIVFLRYALSTIRESLSTAKETRNKQDRTERSYRQSEESYHEVFNATSDAFFIFEVSSGTMVDANDAGVRMYGYASKEELLSTSIEMISSRDERYSPEHARELLRRGDTGTPQSFEWQAQRKDGTMFWVEVSVRNATIGGLSRILAVVRDITEKREAEIQLRESEHRLRVLSDSAFEGIAITSSGHIVEANDQVAAMLGYTRQELIGKGVIDFVAPVSRSYVMHMIQSGSENPYEHLALKRDGTEFWVEVRGRMTSIDGRPVRVTVMRDIDLQKRQSFKLEHNARQLRSIIRSASRSAFITTNLDGIITAFNPGAELMLGYTADEMVGIATPIVFHLAEEVADRGAELQRQHGTEITGFEVFVHTVRKGRHEEREWTYVRKDGSRLTVSLVVTPIHDDHGTLIGFLGVARDISEKKEAEERIRLSEQLFAAAFNSAPLLLTISTLDEGRFLKVNDRCFEYSGYEPEEIIGKTALELGWITKEDRTTILHTLRTKGSVEDMELDLRRKDGRYVNRLYYAQVITIDGEECLLSISLNISERRMAELTIREKEEKFTRLFESAGDAILIMNYDEFVDCNQKTLEVFRVERDGIIGRHPFEFSPPYQPDGTESTVSARQRIEAALAGTAQNFEWMHLRGDGTPFLAEVTLNRIQLASGMQIQAIVRDISDRKKSEEQIRLLAHAVMSARECICIIDLSDTVLYVNEQFLRTYGFTAAEILGNNVGIIRSAKNTIIASDLLRRTGYAADWHGELLHVKRDGTEFPVHVSISAVRGPLGGPEALIGVITDLTEQKRSEDQKKRLEDQLLQAQKMESFGRLAGGIAHDFNNMLTPILGFGELLRKSFDERDARLGRLQQILHAARSSKDLVSKLLAFARKQNLEMKRVDLNAIIADFQKILSRTLRENILISTLLNEEPPVVLGDAGQIEQILLNLAVNAMDAMPDGGGLLIETAVEEIRDGMVVMPDEQSVPPGRYAVLAVTDTGTGMPEEVLTKIYDPFFTTKEKGKGTGLGLSTVYGIVRQHQGSIIVESTVGKGTIFRIYLPLLEGGADSIPDTRATIADGQRRKLTILVVEDQPQILELIDEVLVEDGYVIHTASTVSEAKKLFDMHRTKIDALITDIILPDGNGRQLYELLAVLKPQITVLFMSSYTEDILSGPSSLPENAQFIPKPFTLTAFLEAVHRLDRN